MKKQVLTGLLALALTMTLTSCGDDKTEFKPEAQSKKSDKEVEKIIVEAVKEYEREVQKAEKIEFTYEEDAFLGGMRVKTYTGVEKDVVIPAEIEGKPVVAIGKLGYLGTFFCSDSRVQEAMESVEIPDGVVEISRCFFKNAKNLKEIFLPDSLETIGDEAFRGCEILTEISIPANVKSIGNRVFRDCAALEKVIILAPKENIQIGKNNFQGCAALEKVTVLAPRESIEIEGLHLNEEDGNYYMPTDDYFVSAHSDWYGNFWYEYNYDRALIVEFING